MSAIPRKVTERLVAAIKKFQPILSASKARDDGEADTSMIVTDMLAEVFGYDKFSEVTAEHAIRGTYCDLATKLDGGVQSLIEVKAIGLELKDPNVKQAVDYAANQGVDWVVLTNGVHWRIYSVSSEKSSMASKRIWHARRLRVLPANHSARSPSKRSNNKLNVVLVLFLIQPRWPSVLGGIVSPVVSPDAVKMGRLLIT
jgi:predicted type IV restriction endonuclease